MNRRERARIAGRELRVRFVLHPVSGIANDIERSIGPELPQPVPPFGEIGGGGRVEFADAHATAVSELKRVFRSKRKL